jgi:aminopeptidase YwaD
MNEKKLSAKADTYLNTLCSVRPNRRTGSPGNWEATGFFAKTISPFGYEIDATPFECLDHIDEGSSLTIGTDNFEVFTSPYSLGCDVQSDLVVVVTTEELESANCKGKILLMLGPICSEQLMPKNFVFYNPEHHQKMIALLESQMPAAIITATARSPEQVGALYPFPLIVDGDFDIPSAYCRDTVGASLSAYEGNSARLQIKAKRTPSKARNVIAKLNPDAPKKVVLTAHIDAYEDSPGASDNASGTVVLLLLAEMLSDYRGNNGIEIAAFNGEDHYSAGGQMDYLKRYREEFSFILLAINLDDVGYKDGKSAYSFYDCTDELEKKAIEIFKGEKGLCQGEPWFSGDHMIFVQNKVPAMALTAEKMPELMRTVTHTSKDTPELIDPKKLVELASCLNNLMRSL